jgi:hypothetical protein
MSNNNGSSSARTIQNVVSLPIPPRLINSDLLSLMGASIRYSRNEEIYGEGEPAGYIHKVVSGAVRTSKVFSDGRRQISGFYLPGGAPTQRDRPKDAD